MVGHSVANIGHDDGLCAPFSICGDVQSIVLDKGSYFFNGADLIEQAGLGFVLL